MAGNNSYQYKYNGQELQETGMLDYGWRQYMPELGRWNGMDQLAEMYNSVSPFAYVGNNPINMFDPDGRLTKAFTDQIMNSPSGTTWYNNNNGSFTNNWGDTMSNDGIGVGSGPTPKNSTGIQLGQILSNFFARLFGTAKRDAKISTVLPGAAVSYRVEAGAMEGSFETALKWEEVVAMVGTIARGGQWAIPLMLNGDSSHARGYDIPLTGATDVPAEPDPNLYLYRNMRSVNGMPMIGEGLDKLGLRDKDVNFLPNSTMITPLFSNGLSVTVGYGDSIPSNVPDTHKKQTLYRISASSLISYGLIGIPVPNTLNPFYGQIRPAIPMNVGTFRALIQTTAPAWQPVK